jgi:hypothetical protein
MADATGSGTGTRFLVGNGYFSSISPAMTVGLSAFR